LRASLRFASPNREFVACGERFPIEAAQQDELASEPNRRVDLLFFTEQEAPDLSGAGLSEQIYEHGKLTRVVLDDLEAIEDQCLKEFRVEDAPPPEDGVGELEGSLTTEMQKLENERDPNDEHAYIEPFHDAFPEFLHQADGGVPEPITPSSS